MFRSEFLFSFIKVWIFNSSGEKKLIWNVGLIPPLLELIKQIY